MFNFFINKNIYDATREAKFYDRVVANLEALWRGKIRLRLNKINK